jgi:NADH dehydrogenase [ubiquinone] 1 alpha subcomplex assembly factor 1
MLKIQHLISPAVIPFMLLTVAASLAQAGEDKPAFHLEFADLAKEPKWMTQNDGVMGGRSTGGPAFADGSLEFSGKVSLENNGGFASIMINERKFDLSGTKQMVLRVKGDGRTYRLRMSTDAKHQGFRIVYMAEFPTQAGEWTEVTVPFSSMKPTYHGDDLPGPALDLSKIEEIGLLIGDKREGAFSLKIDWMKAE